MSETNGGRQLVIKDSPATQKALVSRFGDKEFGQALPIPVFIALCNKIGLNPWMGQITPIHGRPYVQHDGWIHLINREAEGQLAELHSEPCSEEDYKRFRVGEDDYLAYATATRRYPNGNTVSLTRRAIVKKSETTGGQGYKPIENEPWDMAEKRARTRVLRSLFNDCLAKVAGDEAPTLDQAQVDTETGEILEGQVVEPEADWSRLWVSAHEQGMDKAAVHAFFKVPAFDGALKDLAEIRVRWEEKPLAQVVQDMADELQLPHESGGEPPAGDGKRSQPEEAPEMFVGEPEDGA